MTVLENDKKSVIKKVTASSTDQTNDLNEISQLLNSTNALLTRNSHLRASLTIKVQRSNSKKAGKTTTFVLPKNPVVPEKVLCSSDSSAEASCSSSSDKCDTSEEESMPSLEPAVNPFSR